MSTRVVFDQKLIEKYGVSGPRYTSYPTAVQFHEGFDEVAYRLHASGSNEDLIPSPLSVYVHLPFCQSLCYYCACTKKITRHARHGEEYLETLGREIALQGALFDRDREVIQLHLGGGTPTFFDDGQLAGLMSVLRRNFDLCADERREFSVEVDPRTVDPERLQRLSDLGFNRLSLGIQDVDPAVQEAVNRVQDRESTLALIDAGRSAGFRSVSVDLIYGLPRQTVATFEQTLDTVLAARPDRLAIYRYAHLPDLFRAQRLIRPEELPEPAANLAMMQLSVDRLTGAGYEYIGLDHFALPDDALARARKSGGLQRNFQGYSTGGDLDLVGLGVSAISRIGHCYAQNRKDIRQWQAALREGRLPVWRGISLSLEDRVRRHVIEQIMCHGTVCFRAVEERFDIDVEALFCPEVERLRGLSDDGLIALDDDGFRVTPAGMLLARVVAMVFDEYLSGPAGPARFSRII